MKRPHLRKLPVKECRENASSVQIHPLQLTSFLFLSQNPHSPSYPLYKVGASTHYFIYIYKGLDQKRETLKKNVEHHIAPVAYKSIWVRLTRPYGKWANPIWTYIAFLVHWKWQPLYPSIVYFITFYHCID